MTNILAGLLCLVGLHDRRWIVDPIGCWEWDCRRAGCNGGKITCYHASAWDLENGKLVHKPDPAEEARMGLSAAQWEALRRLPAIECNRERRRIKGAA